MTRVALIGLDGATYRVLDPMIDAGAMPALATLRNRGIAAVLRSTVPTYTPPAWVSMATGVNPGRHGIFGFLANTPQDASAIAHSGMIDAPTIWAYLNEMSIRVGTFNVPMTYPPATVDGFMVSGGLAAGWTQPELRNFASDPSVGRLVERVGGRHYPVDTQVNYEKDWRQPAVVSEIERVQALRRKVLAALLEETDVEYVFAVFEGPDRLMHLHYQYVVEGSSWYTSPEGTEVRDRALSYFAELDRAVRDLAEWAGTDGHVVVVSDHGFGPWEKTLNVNLLLHQWGYLTLPSVSRLTRSRLVSGSIQRASRRMLPRWLLLRLKAGVGQRIVWGKTKAFASQVSEQGVHINERGVMAEGIVDPLEVGRLEAELTERFSDLVDPSDGQPITTRIVLRAEVIHGPHAGRAPHLFLMCRDQRYELSDTLAATGPLTDHRDRPWGYHHSDGIFIAAGPAVRPGQLSSGLDIVDVLPTTFHLASLPVPRDLDGRVVEEVLSAEVAARPVSSIDAPPKHVSPADYPFSKEEEAAIEEQLRGLGYVE